jgi:hypothetical protein
MITKEKKGQPLVQEQESAEKIPSLTDDLWENCKGQCGTTPWCRDCMLEKKKLLEETLNREGRSDDK